MQYGEKFDKKLKDDLNEFLKAEKKHLISINLDGIKEDEYVAIVFFYTLKPNGVKLVNSEIMKIKKIGEESHTGYNGVNEKPVILKFTKEEIESMLRGVTDEDLSKWNVTRNEKELERIKKIIFYMWEIEEWIGIKRTKIYIDYYYMDLTTKKDDNDEEIKESELSINNFNIEGKEANFKDVKEYYDEIYEYIIPI